jgi:hypothetical protein
MVRPVKSKSPAAVAPQSSPSAGDTHSVADAGPSHQATPNPSATPISNPSHPISSTLATPVMILNNPGATVDCSSSCAEESSSVNTVPGASAKIVATKGSSIIDEGQPTSTDSSGAAVIYWNPSNLTAGTWDIVATVTHNGSTASSAVSQLTVTH